METYGKLIVRMYVHTTKPDTHGRVAGVWRTLMTRWCDRENVEQLLLSFTEANPELHVINRQLRVTFEVKEELISWY